MGRKSLFVTAFIIALFVIAYQEIRNCPREGNMPNLPWPPRIIATGLVFVLLDLFSLFDEDLANITAFGFVLGLIVNQYQYQKTGQGNRIFGTTICNHGTATAQPSAFEQEVKQAGI